MCSYGGGCQRPETRWSPHGNPLPALCTGSFPHREGLTLKLYTFILPTSISPLTTLWAPGYAYPQLGLHSGGLTAEETLEMGSGPLKQGLQF